MRLIVGLGNPGAEYADTPHNLGFAVVDRLAARAGARIERPEAKSYIGRAQIAGQLVLLAKPQTYMNASGMAVRELVQRHEADPAETIVIFDDASLPWGTIRVRERGSSGGHNGLESILSALDTHQIIRVRLGIQPDFPVTDLAAYVLRPIPRACRADASEILDCAVAAVETILAEGAKPAMSRFNRRRPAGGPPE